MRRSIIALFAGAFAMVAWGATVQRSQGARPFDPATSAAAPAHWKVLDQYCEKCHNSTDWAGGLAFDVLSPDTLAEEAPSWEKAIRKLRTGMMPPAGEPRPPRAELDAFATEIEGRLDKAAEVHRAPGSNSLHRLNRTEYANAVHDLLAYDVDVAALLPADDSAEGFDNMADVLGVSPTLINAYVAAAMKISRGAVGDVATPAATVRYTPPTGLSQLEHIEGLPLGTRGGMRIVHEFPVDAEYEFRVTASEGFHIAGPEGPKPKLDVTLNGGPVDAADPAKFRIRVKAGPQAIGVSFVEQLHWEDVDGIYSKDRFPHDVLESVVISGPYEATGAGDTPSRRAIFSCHPAIAAEEAPCARQILTRLASKAFRRPLRDSDASVQTLFGFYERAQARDGFEAGIREGVARLLVDPRFLYRMEVEPGNLRAGDIYPVGDIDLASRLSFFLWSTIPDDELLQVAATGSLGKPEVLEQQVRRMLADPRARALTDNFAGQWLRLRELRSSQPLDAAFDENLRQAFTRETQLFFADIVQNDRSITRFLDSDYTFLNERLARHYGVANVRGDYMRRVALAADSPRRGLLGQGSILTVTSVGNRTSPVMRGSWILETFLGARPPRPPPGIDADLKEGPSGAQPKSVRERLEMHRQNPSCASCHAIMDPVGFSMENFDLIGRWRDKDGDTAVDAHGSLIDGTPLAGPADLRRFLVSQSDQFAISFTEKLLTYALGRRLQASDEPAVRQIVRDARAGGYRFSSLVLGVVDAVPFRMRVKQ